MDENISWILYWVLGFSLEEVSEVAGEGAENNEAGEGMRKKIFDEWLRELELFNLKERRSHMSLQLPERWVSESFPRWQMKRHKEMVSDYTVGGLD